MFLRPTEAFEDRKDQALARRRRGLELLTLNLTPEQLEDFTKTRSFLVLGGTTGRVYTITCRRWGNIRRWSKDNPHRTDATLCGGPYTRDPKHLPTLFDVMLAQKWYLEMSELEFLKSVNVFSTNWGAY